MLLANQRGSSSRIQEKAEVASIASSQNVEDGAAEVASTSGVALRVAAHAGGAKAKVLRYRHALAQRHRNRRRRPAAAAECHYPALLSHHQKLSEYVDGLNEVATHREHWPSSSTTVAPLLPLASGHQKNSHLARAAIKSALLTLQQ